MDYGKLDINAVCFGILCNFAPICGEKRAKEAVELVRSLQSENEKLRAKLEQSDWISVEDRLPDKELKEYQRMNHGGDRIEVIVLIEGTDEATTLDYNGEDFVNDWNDPFVVTHWMPLPQPPKEARND